MRRRPCARGPRLALSWGERRPASGSARPWAATSRFGSRRTLYFRRPR